MSLINDEDVIMLDLSNLSVEDDQMEVDNDFEQHYDGNLLAENENFHELLPDNEVENDLEPEMYDIILELVHINYSFEDRFYILLSYILTEEEYYDIYDLIHPIDSDYHTDSDSSDDF